MSGQRIEAIYFDAVGTLLFPNPSVSRTYASFARKHQMELSEAEIGARLRPAYMRQEEIDHAAGWRTDEAREKDRWRSIIAEVLPGVDLEACFQDLWNWYGKPEAWSVHPDAATLLPRLAQQGYKLGLASNFDGRLAGLVNSMPTLKEVEDHCVISSLVGWRKPAREFFEMIQQQVAVPAENILYVGDDRRNDYEGAKGMGFQALLFDPEGKEKQPHSIGSLLEVLNRI